MVPVLALCHTYDPKEQTMNITSDRTVGSLVAEDFRAAAPLTRYGIDFCCKGGRTIEEVCRTKGIDQNTLENEIREELARSAKPTDDPQNWTLTRLADHIEHVHHGYVNARVPVLLQYLEKLCKVHGDRHPELFEIHGEFVGCAQAMAMHMKKEELVLFPFIKQMERAVSAGTPIPEPHFGTVNNPVNMMREDHDAEGERFRRIAELSNGYTNPPDGCMTYRTAFAMLQEFEQDLHRHIHLENNILFPKAIAMEQTRTAAPTA